MLADYGQAATIAAAAFAGTETWVAQAVSDEGEGDQRGAATGRAAIAAAGIGYARCLVCVFLLRRLHVECVACACVCMAEQL